MTKGQKDFPPTPSQLSVLWNYLTLPWARGKGAVTQRQGALERLEWCFHYTWEASTRGGASYPLWSVVLSLGKCMK